MYVCVYAIHFILARSNWRASKEPSWLTQGVILLKTRCDMRRPIWKLHSIVSISIGDMSEERHRDSMIYISSEYFDIIYMPCACLQSVCDIFERDAINDHSSLENPDNWGDNLIPMYI